MVKYNEKREQLCRFCKIEVGTIKSARRVDKKGNIFNYLSCRKCNTELARRYRKTIEGKKKVFMSVYKSINKLRFKQKARILLHNHLRAGHMVKPITCEKCGDDRKLEGHHQDYSKPLEVLFLCSKCHGMTRRKDYPIYPSK